MELKKWNETKKDFSGVVDQDWLCVEEAAIEEQNKADYKPLPSPKFEENKITVLTIDASKPFGVWKDQQTGKVKRIIPCKSTVNGALQDCLWWLNQKNPIYVEVVHLCREALNRESVLIKVMQTGNGAATQYHLIKE